METKKGMSLLFRMMRGSRSSFLLAALSVVAAAAFTLVDPVILRIALDSALGGKPVEAPAWFQALSSFLGGPEAFAASVPLCAVAMVALNLAQGAFLFLKGWLSSRAAEGTAWNLRTALFEKLSSLPHGYLETVNRIPQGSGKQNSPPWAPQVP